MTVIRPPEGSYLLPPGLSEESFDVDTRLGRANLLALLYGAVTSVNRQKPEIADLLLLISGPVTYFYSPGGGIPWDEVREVFIHPVNLKNIGFSDGLGSLPLKTLFVKTLAGDMERAGFSLSAGPASLAVPELQDLRITVYSPVEAGYITTLWDVLDPATSIAIGPAEGLQWLRETIGLLPDKRTRLAGQFINDAKGHAAAGDLHRACRPLAGAAQVLGRIRLRGEIVQGCKTGGADIQKFRRFLDDIEEALATLDGLWRHHAGSLARTVPALPLEPISITLRELEVGDFSALCRDLGAVCIATKCGDTVIISLDKHELERRASTLGTENVLNFSIFFAEVPVPVPADAGRFFRIRDADGTLRYYELREE